VIDGIPLLAPAPAARAQADTEVASALRVAAGALADNRGLTVVVNDPQRATATPAVLAALADALPPAPRRALVATGTHPYDAATRRAFEQGLRAAAAVGEIAWHHARADDLADVPGPAPWRCHPWLIDEAWGLLAIGSCEPHYFAGITGAHKTVTIGCAAYDDVQANHAHALDLASAPCRLGGNPVHEGIAAMVAGLEARRPICAVNLLQLGPDVLAAAGGTPLEALDALAPAVGDTYTVTIDRPADALILDVSGPMARSFYQADKAIKNNESAVRDGGAIVLVATCPDGVGQDHFMQLLRDCPDCPSVEAAVSRRGYRLGDHKAVRLRRLTHTRRVRVFAVCPGLSDRDLSVLGFARAGDIAAALAAADIDPARHQVFRVADAANTVVTATGS